jgi:hypothetical protein
MEALEELDAKARRMKKGMALLEIIKRWPKKRSNISLGKLCEYLRSGCAAGVM